MLADFKPSGKYVMEDLHNVGGTPGVMKMPRKRHDRRLVHDRDKTIAENLADLPGLTPGQEVVRPLDNPIKKSGHIQILRGNLAPAGAVAKITGKGRPRLHRPHCASFELRGRHDRRTRRPARSKGRRCRHPLRRLTGGPGMPDAPHPPAISWARAWARTSRL
ncbi:MAG: dihydroxy-acid dehydratase [Phycisphaerales bacterium]